MAKEGTKTCKYCKSEIPADAKICPNCRKKQGGIGKWIIIGIVVLLIIGVAAGGNDKDKSSKTASGDTGTTTEAPVEEKIEYQDIAVGQLNKDLEANAMKASDTYKGNYYAVTGKLSNIDAQGGYISITDPDDEWDIMGIQCYIKTDEVKDIVKELSTGDIITVRGKITDVGEVLGYQLDIDSIDQ